MKKLLFVLLSFCCMAVSAQPVANGFRYQTTLRNASGNIIPGQTVNLRFSFYSGSPSGTLQWQEQQLVTTDSYGAVKVIVGSGTSTGAGLASAFSTINWQSANYFLKISIDLGSGYTDMGSTQLFSVPYAFYAKSTAGSNSYSLSDFQDVNLSGIANGRVLKWNGSYWVPGTDNHSDTVLYAYNAGHAGRVDTANYAYAGAPDTVVYAYQSGNATYSGTATTAANAATAPAADTATYALASAPVAWQLTGNTASAGQFIGTNDTSRMNFRTNNVLRATLKGNHQLNIGATANNASLYVVGNDGMVASGTFGSGALSVSGAGTRMVWFPGKGTFRAGTVAGNLWDTANMGANSFAVGYNTTAGINSFCSGYNSEAVDYCFSVGNNCHAQAVGAYPGGNSIALGDSSYAVATRSVAIGRGNVTTSTTCIAIGRGNQASGSVSVAMGVGNNSNSNDSYTFGYHAFANGKNGVFIYADKSSGATLSATAINQFIVRAAGGIIFYSDSARTMGVSLAPGSGSWASVSDVHKKTNFETIDEENILAKVVALKITSWNYKSQANEIRHIGPMAQDFYKAFHLGESNKMILGTDMDGIILASIKALNKRCNALQTLNHTDTLKTETSQLETDFQSMDQRLDAIEAVMKDRQ